MVSRASLRAGEREEIEALCEAAIPGPLIVDDLLDGEGTVVAEMTDGRRIVSTGIAPGECASAEMVESTAQLFCRSRTLLLRLLNERERLMQECRALRHQLATLHQATDTEQPSLPR